MRAIQFIALVLVCTYSLGAEEQRLAVADPPAKPRVEVVFVLDTTGSMSGLIQTAKTKIWRSPIHSPPPSRRRISRWDWSPTGIAATHT